MGTRGTLAGLVMMATVVGCGGSDEPTAQEKRDAKNRWVQHVDSACRKANKAISKRGWPVNLVDLDRLVVRGIEDARGAIDTIVHERIPKGAGPKPAAFVRELKALDGDLTKLSDASEDLKPAALVKAADAIKPRIATVEQSARDAGLSACLTHDERSFVPDGIRAPVFAEQFARLDRSLLGKMRKIKWANASTPGEFAQAFKRYSELIDGAVEGIDKLDPPLWAADQTANYQAALRDLQSLSQKFTALLVADKGKPLYALDLSKYTRVQKQVNVAARKEAKALRKLSRAVGAAPTLRTPQQETEDPESGEVS